MSELERKDEEIFELRSALKECVTVLDCDALKDAWIFLFTHGYKYDGPSIDMIKMRSIVELKN